MATFEDIDIEAMEEAIADMPREFGTADLISHPSMEAAHVALEDDHTYDMLVGQLLGYRRREFRIVKASADGETPTRWRKIRTPNATELEEREIGFRKVRFDQLRTLFEADADRFEESMVSFDSRAALAP